MTAEESVVIAKARVVARMWPIWSHGVGSRVAWEQACNDLREAVDDLNEERNL